MKECIELLVLLGISVVSNSACGIYLNIGKLNEKFDKRKLINGVSKAGCVCISALGLAYIVEKMPDLSSAIGIEPKAMIVSAIAVYSGKTAISLAKILGVSQTKMNEVLDIKENETEFVDM